VLFSGFDLATQSLDLRILLVDDSDKIVDLLI
jgi:hypothetical protein